MKTALVIGGGPAGLMAADELSRAGAAVTVIEAKPSLGRKFLMAGKSGLNLTKVESLDTFVAQYREASDWLSPMISQFAPTDVADFAQNLGQSVFTGTSGRVFPEKMKASPLLRAWIERLAKQNVTFHTKWRWQGWNQEILVFDTPEGVQNLTADVVVFALGGASWARLGSDGEWSTIFSDAGVALAPFGASNAAIDLKWSPYMAPHFGTPVKAVAFTSGSYSSRGEAVISDKGLEGGGIYSVSRGVREGHALIIDLKPDWTLERVRAAIDKPRGKSTVSNHLRRVLKLEKHELALINEWKRPFPSISQNLAAHIKAISVNNAKLRPIDEAISTSGGITRGAVNENLMLLNKPGTFCAGEMLDWEAPTGGYLLTACFATGRTAGRGAADYLGLMPTREPV